MCPCCFSNRQVLEAVYSLYLVIVTGYTVSLQGHAGLVYSNSSFKVELPHLMFAKSRCIIKLVRYFILE